MILVLNCGSQSIKYKLFEEDFRLVREGEKKVKRKKNYQQILEKELLTLSKFTEKISKVCHRVVHGGDDFREPVQLTKDILRKLEKVSDLAPLHNPYNLLGVKICFNLFPQAKEIAVFDTDFYRDLPEKAYRYPLPEKLVKKYGFRRFGFHGLSHEYAAQEGARLIKEPLKKLRIITCHLGGGSSVTAIRFGKAIETSMGFTPLGGLVMMTRVGDLDPGIILKLAEKIPLEKLKDILNCSSGVKGISGLPEMLDVLVMIKKGDKKAKLALDLFVYHLQKYIGAYFVILGGCDVLIFTGTIGYGSAKIRRMVVKDLKILDKTKVLAIKANEELHIIKKTKNL